MTNKIKALWDALLTKATLHPLTLLLFVLCGLGAAVAMFTGHDDMAMLLAGVMTGTLVPALVKVNKTNKTIREK